MKRGPWILIGLLLVIFVFIIGVRYGQQVEKVNKFIDYVNKLPPTPTVVKPSPLEFKTYQNKTCGVSFLYPSSLAVKDSSMEAVFTDSDGTSQIDLSCPILHPSAKAPQPTLTDLLFKQQKIKADLVEDQSKYHFSFVNPKTGKLIDTTISIRLYPLFEKSLSY